MDGSRLMAGRGRGGEGTGRGRGGEGRERGRRGGGRRVQSGREGSYNTMTRPTRHFTKLLGTGTVPTLGIALDGHPEVPPLLSKLRRLYPLLAVSWLKVCCY